MPDEILAVAGPEHWIVGQLEWIDGQLSNQVRNRARHRTDVQLYARVQAHLPLRYHQQQVDHCTTRIDELLDLRLRVVQRAAQEGQH